VVYTPLGTPLREAYGEGYGQFPPTKRLPRALEREREASAQTPLNLWEIREKPLHRHLSSLWEIRDNLCADISPSLGELGSPEAQRALLSPWSEVRVEGKR